jgi:hypothetical protein
MDEMAALQKMPRAEARLASWVSSAMCPDASNPVRTDEVERKASIQFQTSGAPVPLYVEVNTKAAVWKP